MVVPSPTPMEDPLNVLGLSNLASARLRQRLHVPRDLRREVSLLTTSTENAVNLFNHYVRTPTSNNSTPIQIGGRLAAFVSLSFLGQLKLMINTLITFTKALITSLKIMANFASRAIPEILNNGGFGHSVRMVSVVSIAIILMFRPLLKGTFNNTPLHG